MSAYLCQIDGWAGSTPTPLRMASHDDDRLCHLNGQTWWPSIVALPKRRYDFFDGAFGGGIVAPTGSIDIQVDALPNLPGLALHDARFRLWKGELGAAWSAYELLVDGRVQDQPTVTDGRASISFGVDDSWLDQPLLSPYAGTGGLEGGADLKGQPKPLLLGAPRYAPGVLIDTIDNVWQLSAYGAIEAVEVAFGRLIRYGTPVGDAADLVALKAMAIPRGRWATCLAQGLVRFGAPPDGPICFHVRGDKAGPGGWVRRAGGLIGRIADMVGASGRVSSASLSALDAARPWNLSPRIDGQVTARDLIQRIAAGVNAVAVMGWNGTLYVHPIGIGSPSVTLAADGSALPPVAEVRQLAQAAPFWRLAQQAEVTQTVHALSDVAFAVTPVDRGAYNGSTLYREGDMVTLPDQSRWRFVGTTPAAGSLPADGNANWSRMTDAVTAGDVTYQDGTTVEQLKPAEPGATEGMTPAERQEVDQLAGSLGNVDALVTAAQSQIAAIESSVSGLQGQAAAIIASIGDVDTRVDQVETGISTLNGSVTTLSQTVTNLNGTVSTLSQTVTTQGGQISTVAQSVTTLSGSMSTLSSTVSAQGVTISQNATAISTLQGQQSILSTTVSTQGAAITTLQTTTSTLQGDTATLRTQVTAGSPNLLRNGGFELGTMNYWSWSAGAAFGVIASTDTWGIFAVNNTNIPDNSHAYIFSNPVGIERDYYTLTADTGYFLSGGAGNVYLQMDFLNAGGGYISSAYGPAVTNGNNFSADGSTRRATKLTAYAPDGATQVRAFVVWYKANGVAQSMHVRQVKLERGQVATPYSAEASARQSFEALDTLTSQYALLSSTVGVMGATVSTNSTAISSLQGNVNALYAKWGVEIDVNGYISGVTLNNNGSRSDFILNADKFAIVKSGGGARTEYSGGNWRIYNAAGNLKMRWGTW